MFKRNAWHHISIAIRLYVLALLVFTLFRVILFLTETARIDETVSVKDILLAFVMGLRFDVVITGYILILPFLILSILYIFNWTNQKVLHGLKYFMFVFFLLAFGISAADIPYFNQFFTRFTVDAFKWFDNPVFVFKMIFEEPRYWLTIIPFAVLTVSFYLVLNKIWRDVTVINDPGRNKISKTIWSILFLGVMFLGIRGRIDEKSPIRIGTAFFSNNAFLNQLGLNPNFTFIRSIIDHNDQNNKPVQLMDDREAVEKVQQYLNVQNLDPSYPFARMVSGDSGAVKKFNVVLIMMESMSAGNMERHGNPKTLTPFLDSLSTQGLYFENYYTAGIHTYNGIFSSLFSFPGIYHQHAMKESTMIRYNGMAHTLKKNGYATTFFIPHDGQFDNVEGFLRANDFDNVYSKPDYPSDQVKTTLGVPDDVMFSFSIPILNDLAQQKEPFLAAYMTASDHGPYYLPDYFKPTYTQIKDQMVEYADWSLRTFFEQASHQPWFEHTLFVFTADHGTPMDATYDMPLSYNHSPLIMYNPELTGQHTSYTQMAGQIDIFPTIMGLLNFPYVNNTFGIDLLRQQRAYSYFCNDDKFGVIDQEWFFIAGQDGTQHLYKYQSKDKNDYKEAFPEITTQMSQYGAAHIQAYQYLMLNGKQYYE